MAYRALGESLKVISKFQDNFQFGITKFFGYQTYIFYNSFVGPILGAVSSYLGWTAVLYLQIALSILAALTIYKADYQSK